MHNLLSVCYSPQDKRSDKDHDKAVAWYMKAAEQGQVDAQFNLGCCWPQGMVHGGIIVRLSPGSARRQHKAMLGRSITWV